MKKISLVLLFILGLTETFAQQPPKLNILMPSAAEVSALGKFGLMPVDYFTGTPDISTPVYTVQEGNLSFPFPSGTMLRI
jgi:hypothetical protein